MADGEVKVDPLNVKTSGANTDSLQDSGNPNEIVKNELLKLQADLETRFPEIAKRLNLSGVDLKDINLVVTMRDLALALMSEAEGRQQPSTGGATVSNVAGELPSAISVTSADPSKNPVNIPKEQVTAEPVVVPEQQVRVPDEPIRSADLLQQPPAAGGHSDNIVGGDHVNIPPGDKQDPSKNWEELTGGKSASYAKKLHNEKNSGVTLVTP